MELIFVSEYLGSFRRHGLDRGRPVRRRRGDSHILREIRRDPTTSIRRVAERTGKPATTVHRVLKAERLHPFHYTPVQDLEEFDPVARLEYCRVLLRKRAADPSFLENILFTDEATFTRNGVFNFHNAHTWAETNPHNVWENNSQTQFKVNVWCGIVNKILLGPYKIDHLNGVTYLNFLENDFEEMFDDNIPLSISNKIYFMQDGAPAHYSLTVRDYLDERFPEKWIGRRGSIAWPARSPDLTPCDFFLWGYLKSYVYQQKLENVDQLWQRINEGCDSIRANPRMLINVQKNLFKRIRKCVAEGGNHFEHILRVS